MGRPRGFEEDVVLDAAMHAFWDKGYEATSMSDLMQAMNLRKGSIYKAFGSKKELFITVLNRYMDSDYERYRTLLDDADTPMEGLKQLIHSIAISPAGDQDNKGCFIVNTVIELAPHDRDFEIILDRQMRRIEALIESAIFQGQGAGEMTTETSAEDLAEAVMVFINGMQMDSKCTYSQDRAERLCHFILESVRSK